MQFGLFYIACLFALLQAALAVPTIAPRDDVSNTQIKGQPEQKSLLGGLIGGLFGGYRYPYGYSSLYGYGYGGGCGGYGYGYSYSIGLLNSCYGSSYYSPYSYSLGGL